MLEQTVSIAPIIDWINDYSGALTVIITLVYVVATVLIWMANYKSAQVAKDQLEESKRQYIESNRPIVEVDFLYERRVWYIVRFSNHGRRTAQRVRIDLDQEFIDCLSEPKFASILEGQKNKECIIGVDQHYDLYIGSNELRKNPNKRPVTGRISYQCDEKTYTSEIYIDLNNYMTFFSTNTDHDDLSKAIKDNTAALKGIRASIDCLHDKEMSDDDA